MTDREKLIALLKSNQSVLQAAGTSATATLRLADHLIANGVTVQRWVPVTERLPTYGQEVIVYGGNYLKACITAMRFWDEAHVNWYGVTHWMPLPEPPKDVE